MAKKFIEILGNASTTVWNGNVNLGRNVNVAVYEDGDHILLVVESNGERVKSVPAKEMTREEYEDFSDRYRGHAGSMRALESFGLTTPWTKTDEI